MGDPDKDAISRGVPIEKALAEDGIIAWAMNGDIKSVDISIDFGQTWMAAQLDLAVNKFAWQRFRADVTLPEKGYYEVWGRATEMQGKSQPPVVPGWNPRGYGNNMQHRIALIAASPIASGLGVGANPEAAYFFLVRIEYDLFDG